MEILYQNYFPTQQLKPVLFSSIIYDIYGENLQRPETQTL